jgi:hypothetical protein
MLECPPINSYLLTSVPLQANKRSADWWHLHAIIIACSNSFVQSGQGELITLSL